MGRDAPNRCDTSYDRAAAQASQWKKGVGHMTVSAGFGDMLVRWLVLDHITHPVSKRVITTAGVGEADGCHPKGCARARRYKKARDDQKLANGITRSDREEAKTRGTKNEEIGAVRDRHISGWENESHIVRRRPQDVKEEAGNGGSIKSKSKSNKIKRVKANVQSPGGSGVGG